MDAKEARPIKVKFPFNLYFKQLFAQDTYVRFINPFGFWRRYRINHLETCCELNTVQYLESCYNQKWRSSKSIGDRNNQNLKDISPCGQVPAQQISLHKIIVVIPRVELKYRSVNFCKQETPSININNVELVPGISEQNIKAELESISISGICDREAWTDPNRHQPLTEAELTPSQPHCGQFDCNIPLPEPIQVNNIQAELIDGVLTITMPQVNLISSVRI
jgi:HSP20 family protein